MSTRYFPHTEADVAHMLGVCGVPSFEGLLSGVPPELRRAALTEPPAVAEPDLLQRYRDLSRACECRTSFVGAGLYRHFVPTAVDMLISRGEFFTAYTPYQPEASQGTLQAIFEFQSTVCELFGLDVANASMYDFASAAAEAVLLTLRLDAKRQRVVLASTLHPDAIAVIRTYLAGTDARIELLPRSVVRVDPHKLATHLGADVAALVVQNPNCLGLIEEVRAVADVVHAAGAKLIVSVNDPASLGLLASPGACGADIAVGEGTGFGIPVSFGGPGLGLFAAREAFLRQLPGRLVGEARDAAGRLGYVLTLATREQHIRREKATSNICTNHGLCALAFTIHAALLGPRGITDLAGQCAQRARYLARALSAKGIGLRYPGPYFAEVVVELGAGVPRAIARGLEQNIAVGFDLGRWQHEWAGGLLVSVNELCSRARLDRLVDILAEARS